MSNAPPHNPPQEIEFEDSKPVHAGPNPGTKRSIYPSSSPGETTTTQELLPINDALQIQAAEYWLKLGEADEALRELEVLPSRVWRCRWAIKTRIAAMGVLRERSEVQN